MEVIQLWSAGYDRHVVLEIFAIIFWRLRRTLLLRSSSRKQTTTTTGGTGSLMASPFFSTNWEEDTQDALITARTRVVAFIERTADRQLRMQLQWVFDALVPSQEAIRLLSAFLLVSKKKNLFVP